MYALSIGDHPLHEKNSAWALPIFFIVEHPFKIALHLVANMAAKTVQNCLRHSAYIVHSKPTPISSLIKEIFPWIGMF